MSPKRIFSLDILRGLACMMVLLTHMPIPQVVYDKPTKFWLAIHATRKTSWMGVDLFFVLSGLLISGLLFEELKKNGRIDLKRFWLRRGFKIWPSYFVVYGLYVVAVVIHSNYWHDAATANRMVADIWPNILFVQNYLHQMQWPNSWSIAVEEHFYLVLPLLLAALAGFWRLRWLPALIGCLCVGVFAVRVNMALHGANWEEIKYPTHLHVDALLFGVLLGYFAAYYPERLARVRKWWPAAIATAAAVCAFFSRFVIVEHPELFSIAFTIAYLAMGALVLMAKLHPTFGATGLLSIRIPCRILATIGMYSYTIYLVHGTLWVIPGMRAAYALFKWPLWQPCLFLAVAILSGMFICHCVERPFLALRQRLLPSAKRLFPPERARGSGEFSVYIGRVNELGAQSQTRSANYPVRSSAEPEFCYVI